MVNALLCDLPSTVYDAKEIDMVLGYLQQLHFVHGYETIFLSKGAFGKLEKEMSFENQFVKKVPQMRNRDDRSVKKVRETLDEILWSMKKLNIADAQLGSFLDIFSAWIEAGSLKALVIVPMTGAISSFSHFFHVLNSDIRDIIDPVADDVELWFFSHFGDVPIQWPYYLDFSDEAREALMVRFDFDQFKDLRTSVCRYSLWREVGVVRENMLLKGAEFATSVLRFAETFHRNKIVITQSAIGVSNDNILASEELKWNYPSLRRVLGEPFPEFSSCFIMDRFYSSEFIKKMQPLGSLKNKTNPLAYYSLFELACEKEIHSAQENFKKRKIKHIS